MGNLNERIAERTATMRERGLPEASIRAMEKEQRERAAKFAPIAKQRRKDKKYALGHLGGSALSAARTIPGMDLREPPPIPNRATRRAMQANGRTA